MLSQRIDVLWLHAALIIVDQDSHLVAWGPRWHRAAWLKCAVRVVLLASFKGWTEYTHQVKIGFRTQSVSVLGTDVVVDTRLELP